MWFINQPLFIMSVNVTFVDIQRKKFFHIPIRGSG